MNLNDPAELDRIQLVCDAATDPIRYKKIYWTSDGCWLGLLPQEPFSSKPESLTEQDVDFCIMARTALPLSIAALRERTWKPITEMSRDDMETGMNFILWSPKTHAGPHEGRYWTQENEWCDTDGYVMKPTLFMPLPTPPQEETAGPHRAPA